MIRKILDKLNTRKVNIDTKVDSDSIKSIIENSPNKVVLSKLEDTKIFECEENESIVKDYYINI